MPDSLLSTTTLKTETQDDDSRDILVFSMCIAVALHALLIFGVTFSSDKHSSLTMPTLEITLANQPLELKQDNADFLAQADQEASGSVNKKQQMTTDQVSEFKDTLTRDIQKNIHFKSSTAQRIVDKTVIMTSAEDSPSAFNPVDEDNRETADIFLSDDIFTLIPDRTEVATLHARLDKLRQEYAKRPRISTLTAVSAKSAPEAEYLAIWQEKIERLGNRYYPEEARSKQISGSLRLLVAIDNSGEVIDIKVTQSSGHPVLDQAAITTVKLSSPFPPFPTELRQYVDQLEIIRTWQFGKGTLLTR